MRKQPLGFGGTRALRPGRAGGRGRAWFWRRPAHTLGLLVGLAALALATVRHEWLRPGSAPRISSPRVTSGPMPHRKESPVADKAASPAIVSAVALPHPAPLAAAPPAEAVESAPSDVQTTMRIYSPGVSVFVGGPPSVLRSAPVSVLVGGPPAIVWGPGVSVGIAPLISSLSANFGVTGASVTVTGANFGPTQGSSTVSFGGALATASSWSDNSIVVAVPAQAAGGNGMVTVIVHGMSTNGVAFAVAPFLSGVSPNTGDPGTSVVLSGTHFGSTQGGGGVAFNGTPATVLAWSDSGITVQVPNGASTGSVVVSSSSGIASNGASFTVKDDFSLTLVAPLSGQAGSLVTLTGGGFGPTQGGSSVVFNGATAAINRWSDTQILATVPAAAATGPVSVLVGNGSTESPQPFVVNTTVLVTDSLGHVSSYTATMQGGVWYTSEVIGPGCSTCARGPVRDAYDSQGNLTTHTDELGRVTTYTYDASSNLLSQSQPLDAQTTVTTSYTYNSLGEVLTVTDPLGATTSNSYDAHGNLLSVTTPAPGAGMAASVTQFAYNGLGELVSITDPLGHVTQLTYTPVGLIAGITDAQQNVTSYQYDAHGNRTAVVDPLGNTTLFAYDAGDRLAAITYPDTASVSFGYDSRGRRTSVADPDNHTTTYIYDDADRLVSVTDAAGNVTQYGYDTENNLLSVTDAAQHVTSFSYDPLGRVVQTVFPSTLAESYVYDGAGNLTSKTDRKGQTIQYVYDALNRLTHKGYPDSTGVDYMYDLAGKIKKVTDPTGSYGLAYDNLGRLLGTTTQYAFLPGTTFSNGYSYDAASNRTGFTAPDGSANTYQYDSLNRLMNLTNSASGAFTFSYDAASRRTGLNRPNGVSTAYSYDARSNLLSVLHQAGGATLDGASYVYDPAGNRTAKTNQLNHVTEQYGYDALYELTQVTQGAATSESYTYDAVGNRLSSLGAPAYNYNASNELTSTSNGSYTYDNNGNLATKNDPSGATQYRWDFENRLNAVALAGTGGTVSFQYDPWGKRIQKSFAHGATVTTTNYVYDGANLIAEVDQSGNKVARYTQGFGVDEPLSEVRGTTTAFYQQDGLGSVTSLSGAAEALSNTYTYDTFGNLIATAGTIANHFQYTARDYDPETGLRYYRARYYASDIGRFATEDPVQFNGGINFYAYVENDPVGLVDPFGFCPWQVHKRPLKGIAGVIPGTYHVYFYNILTGQSIGLGPASLAVSGKPVPGTWETNEKPGTEIGPVPEYSCNCVDHKTKHPGNPPNYCTYRGAPPSRDPKIPWCANCNAWITEILSDCYDQEYSHSRGK